MTSSAEAAAVASRWAFRFRIDDQEAQGAGTRASPRSAAVRPGISSVRASARAGAALVRKNSIAANPAVTLAIVANVAASAGYSFSILAWPQRAAGLAQPLQPCEPEDLDPRSALRSVGQYSASSALARFVVMADGDQARCRCRRWCRAASRVGARTRDRRSACRFGALSTGRAVRGPVAGAAGVDHGSWAARSRRRMSPSRWPLRSRMQERALAGWPGACCWATSNRVCQVDVVCGQKLGVAQASMRSARSTLRVGPCWVLGQACAMPVQVDPPSPWAPAVNVLIQPHWNLAETVSAAVKIAHTPRRRPPPRRCKRRVPGADCRAPIRRAVLGARNTLRGTAD
jgi:hypothetical protein